MLLGALHSSPRTYTYTAADDSLWDLNGLKTSVATNVAAQAYSGAALNGVLANPGPATLNPPRYPTVTNTSSAGTYRTGASFPIVFTGTYGGVTVTENLLLTAANGNETIKGNQPFDVVTSIAVPGQVDASGAFTFGVDGVAARSGQFLRAVRANAAGNVKVGYEGGFTDTIPMNAGELLSIAPTRIYGNGGTAVQITIFE